jgi:uncharacterized protein YbjT (DUF2867 family)
MKVIVTGATGFVGKAVLKKSIEDQRIDEVLILSRRDIHADLSGHPKVEVLIRKDFSTYPTPLTD